MRLDMPEQIFIYGIRADKAVIWKCFSREEEAVIPEEIDGHIVEEIAAYCFSDQLDRAALEKGLSQGEMRISATGMEEEEIRELQGRTLEELMQRMPVLGGMRVYRVQMPKTVRKVGRYCFYHCDRLHALEYSSVLNDWGSGVFTGCHHVKEMAIHLGADEKSVLKDLLEELPESLTLEYWVGEEKKAVILFPEFYEEGTENTPARLLSSVMHGTGMHYRYCFKSRVFDFVQYDQVFPYARFHESFEILSRLAYLRLQYPYQLTGQAKKQYEDYALEERDAYASWFVEHRDLDGLMWLTGLVREKYPECMTLMMELAGRTKFVEAVSYLMEQQHDRKPEGGQEKKKRRRLEL